MRASLAFTAKLDERAAFVIPQVVEDAKYNVLLIAEAKSSPTLD
jgi:hypothetical protein